MAIAQVVAGARILISDLNAYYSLLKGSSGETITLVYNAAGSVIIQPSSDPAADTQAIQIKNNAGTVQSALTYDGNAILKTYVAFGAIPAIAGTVRFANTNYASGRDTGNTTDIVLLQIFSDDVVYLGDAAAGQGTTIRANTAKNVALSPTTAGNVNFAYAVTALGGGAAPTVGTIGGSGPGTAGQNSWLKILINGTASFIPIWR